MKITIRTPKSRNPWVAITHFRRAGTHRPRGGTLRQQAGRTLKRELDQLERIRHSP